jgi:threonine dehydratase
VNTSELVRLADIERAAVRIGHEVRRTPLVATDMGTSASPLWLKAENLQLGGSFKFRGALNALRSMRAEDLDRGVVTHSSGNHAQAVARAARLVGVAATVVMPRNTPGVKRRGTQEQGATVVLVEASERAPEAERIRAETGAAFLPPYDHPDVIAGQGTVGLEIVDDLPDLATVLVPVSGGGLVSGIAAAVKARVPEARLVAVEPELAGDLAEGWASGERVTWDASRTGRTIADGLRVQGVGELNWLHIRALVDDVITVAEDEILDAMRRVVLDAKLVCEPSGAVAVAGYLSLRDRHLLPTGAAVAVVSGGNVEPGLLARVLAG